MKYKKKRYFIFILFLSLCMFLWVINGSMIISLLIGNTKISFSFSNAISLLLTVSILFIMYLLFRMNNRSIAITEKEIIEVKSIGKPICLPIDTISQIDITYIPNNVFQRHYSPKGRERYHDVLKEKKSILFKEDENHKIWEDFSGSALESMKEHLKTQIHLSEEEKEIILYQKYYEQAYIDYEEAVLRATYDIPTITINDALRVGSILHTAKEIKNVHSRIKEYNEQNENSKSFLEELSESSIGSHVLPYVDLDVPYAINDVESFSFKIHSTKGDSLSINLTEYVNPLAIYSDLIKIVKNSNGCILLNDSAIHTQKKYIPTTYRGDRYT